VTAALGVTVDLSLGMAEGSLARVVGLCATVGFVAGGMAIAFTEGAALTYVFACASLTVATPRSTGDHVPWWSLVLNEGGGTPRLLVSCLVVAAVSLCYVSSRSPTLRCWASGPVRRRMAARR
jgi:hypothetical protein